MAMNERHELDLIRYRVKELIGIRSVRSFTDIERFEYDKLTRREAAVLSNLGRREGWVRQRA